MDWPALMAAGMGGLRLPPETFWALTPAELMTMLGLAKAAPMDRARLGELAASMERMAAKMETGAGLSESLGRVADSQERLVQAISDSGLEGIDAESRMRLRSIDVQLLRILEEMSAGRQESIADLRGDLINLANAIKARG